MLNLHPNARMILAGDSNVYLSEIMGSGRGKSGELRVRRLPKNLCRDFGLAIANLPGVPTHRSGSSIDLVLASRDLVIRSMVVHDGHSCACPTASCFPFLGSDHKLITFEILLEPCGTVATAPCSQRPQPHVGHACAIGGHWCRRCAPSY